MGMRKGAEFPPLTHFWHSSMELSDTQSEADTRGVRINRVGVRGLKYPACIDGMATVAVFSLSVDLPANQRGTHMSRFVALLQEHHDRLRAGDMVDLVRKLRRRLGATAAYLQVEFPWFHEKQAPVSGEPGMMDYSVRWDIHVQGRQSDFAVTVRIPIGTLCPCSKAISERGAHNQRGEATLTVRSSPPAAIVQMVCLVESSASSELYSLLKRTDEKFVTEQAYDNPAFVEDVVRQIALKMATIRGLQSYRIEVENFESIHNHNAFAVIEETRPVGKPRCASARREGKPGKAGGRSRAGSSG